MSAIDDAARGILDWCFQAPIIGRYGARKSESVEQIAAILRKHRLIEAPAESATQERLMTTPEQRCRAAVAAWEASDKRGER